MVVFPASAAQRIPVRPGTGRRLHVRPANDAILLSAALCAALALGGCAGTDPGGAQAPPYAELLSQPQRLEPVTGQSGALAWQVPDAELQKYDRVLLERIQVRIADEAGHKTIDPADLKSLVDYFHRAIVKALGSAYPVVAKPGPGVLRVRIALYDLVPTQPLVSVGIFFTPYATIPDLLSGPATGEAAGAAPYLGRTGIAVQFTDGQTGRVVAEFTDDRFGKKYVIDTSQGAVAAATTGMADYVRSYSTWAYAQQAFDQWAARFRRRLDEIHGR
jgi:hypothetical protein